jgi:sirohydrochlorin cobaltochelatase
VAAGFEKVRLIPFMLVAGTHFREDLTGEDDSWQKSFEDRGIAVEVTDYGMGHIDMITKIYCSHIKAALDIIPL